MRTKCFHTNRPGFPIKVLLRYDLSERLWIAENSKFPEFRATVQAPLESLLLGRHLWTIENDATR